MARVRIHACGKGLQRHGVVYFQVQFHAKVSGVPLVFSESQSKKCYTYTCAKVVWSLLSYFPAARLLVKKNGLSVARQPVVQRVTSINLLTY